MDYEKSNMFFFNQMTKMCIPLVKFIKGIVYIKKIT